MHARLCAGTATVQCTTVLPALFVVPGAGGPRVFCAASHFCCAWRGRASYVLCCFACSRELQQLLSMRVATIIVHASCTLSVRPRACCLLEGLLSEWQCSRAGASASFVRVLMLPVTV